MFYGRKPGRKDYIRILIIVLMLFFIAVLFRQTVKDFYSDLTWNDDRSSITMCDRYINEGNYNDLRDTLILFDSYDGIFDSYWEIADAYEYLSDYKVWRNASLESEDQKAEYEKLMAESREKLLAICSGSSFEQNRMILNSFAGQTGPGAASSE